MIAKIKKTIEEKEKLVHRIETLISNAPDGSMKFQVKNGKIHYYHNVKDSRTGQWCKTYIKKKQIQMAKALTQKSYYTSVLLVLKSQLVQLKNFIETFNEEGVEEIYRNLPEARKVLVNPVAIGIKERIDVWAREEYELNTSYPEFLIYETEQGEMVRTKSELIIANVLYQYKDDIEYKYERPLELKAKDGSNIIVHPDFTIINKHTGRIYYYEHAGRMDEPKYAVDFVKKMNLYSTNGILQGYELFVTYETYSMPLDINCVKKIVERIVEG